jgi:hypothetical protein
MRLAKTLKIGYESKEKQEKKMGRRGYTRDNELSNGDHQAYINKKTGKLLFNITGSHNLKDAVTDGYLAFGGLKNTSRYKTADSALKKAKEKYKPTNVSVVGHSLGGSIAGLISSKSDRVTTLDKGATFGSRIRSNENGFRTSGDAVSILNSNSKRMTTLKNDNQKESLVGNALGGITGGIFNKGIDAYKAHDINNIKNEKIFV